jgi:SAM-dependent methyltransferase
MFTESAALYDLIYSTFKDYPSETAALAALIRREHPRARTILDVACGTAEHARLLARDHGFEVHGLDLDSAFVQLARGKLGGDVYQGDMTSFTLPHRYDVVQCLFSSIGYVRTLDNVRRTLERFREHLAPAGIVLVEPWFAPAAMQHGRVSINTAEADDVRVARMAHTEVDGRLSRIRFEYLIGRATGIDRATEIHELGLFTIEEQLRAFEEAGLEATYDPIGLDGRGLFVARSDRSAPA